MKDSLLLNFPDLKGKESETLYVIGNGFDLFHDLPSSYNHFYCWLINNGYDSFVKQMETIFPATTENKDKLLWKDFEEALGKFDAEDIHNRFGCKSDDLWFDEKRQRMAVKAITPTLDNIRPLMKEWALELSEMKHPNLLYLPKNSLYFTFNYTDVLEKTYQIPKENITHIHGLATANEQVITGYGNHDYKNINLPEDENKEVSIRLINKKMMELHKETQIISDQHLKYYESLHNITRVVFLGHSFSFIDATYLKNIIRNVSDKVHFHVSAHTIKDINHFWDYYDYVHNLCSGYNHAPDLQSRLKKENIWIFNM